VFVKPQPGALLDRSHSINEGLLFYAPFAEMNGFKSKDIAGGVDITVNSGASWSNDIFGRAINYDGTAGYVTAPVAADLTDLSFSCWIRPLSLGSYQRLVTLGNGCFSVLFDGAQAGTQTNNNLDYATPFNTTFSNGKWYHIVVVKSVAFSVTNLWVNGVIDSFTLTTGIDPSAFTAIDLGRHPTGIQYYAGVIDNVRLWKRALTPVESVLLYTDPFVGIDLPDEDLYSFDGGGGSIIAPMPYYRTILIYE
jgi:hypothetical protein